MTYEKAIKELERQKMMFCHDCVHPQMVGWCENHCQIPEAYDMAIKALTAQAEKRTDDTISRQAAIDALEKVAELYPWRVPGDRDSYSKYNEAWQDALNRAESEIEALPSAQTEEIIRY